MPDASLLDGPIVMNLTPQEPVSISGILPRRKDRELSGRAIVAGMFILGLFLASLLFVYFEFNTRPFRPLREALGREFRHSRPNVEGGKLKGRGPDTLRVSMSIPFDPYQEGAQTRMRLAKVIEISRQYHDLAKFDTLEVNLIHFPPERDAVIKTFEWRGIEAADSNFVP